MSSSLKEIGTLIIVVLKARNLPNKRHIGKQDPYCTVEFNKDKRRTKAIRRGGQHPEWDQEIRFTVFEDDSEEPAPTDSDTPPPLPPKKSKERRIKGGKELQMGCYADDPREPELIGETTVDLSEVFSKGETDEWFTLMNKEKYSGEVYLELTFWSNEKPPQKKSSPKNGSNNANYGGPGSFTPSEDPSLRYHAHRHPSQGMSPSRIPTSLSASPLSTRPRSSTVRPSSSLANLDLYSPPYESGAGSPARYPQSDVDSLTHSMAELGVGGGSRRRGSYPPRFDDPNASSGFRLGSPSSSLSHHPESVGYHEFTEPLSSHSSMSSMHSYQSAESYSSRGGSIPSYGSRTFQRDSFSAPPEFYPPSQEAPWDSQYSVDYPNRPPTGFISSPSATPMASHYPGSRPLPTPYVQTPPRPPTTVSSIPQSLSSSYSASTLYTPPRPLSSQTPIPFGYSLPPSLLPGPPASAPPPQQFQPPSPPSGVPHSHSAPPQSYFPEHEQHGYPPEHVEYNYQDYHDGSFPQQYYADQQHISPHHPTGPLVPPPPPPPLPQSAAGFRPLPDPMAQAANQQSQGGFSSASDLQQGVSPSGSNGYMPTSSFSHVGPPPPLPNRRPTTPQPSNSFVPPPPPPPLLASPERAPQQPGPPPPLPARQGRQSLGPLPVPPPPPPIPHPTSSFTSDTLYSAPPSFPTAHAYAPEPNHGPAPPWVTAEYPSSQFSN